MEGKEIDDMVFGSFISRVRETTIERIAKAIGVVIPPDILPYQYADYLSRELDIDKKSRTLSMFRDTVNCTSRIYVLQERTPPYNELRDIVKDFKYEEEEHVILEGKPYFKELDFDDLTNVVKLRFKYFGPKMTVYDPETRRIQQFLPQETAVVVVQPKSRLIEARTSQQRIAQSILYRTVSMLSDVIKLGELKPLNLYTKDCIVKFLDWIEFLSYAGFEFDDLEDIGTLSIGAKRKRDLRFTKRFEENFKRGRLRRGHASIKRDEERILKFRIFFRDARIFFTSLCDEKDIRFILDGIEQISEARPFHVPRELLSQYFD
jgi:hypothetical protein